MNILSDNRAPGLQPSRTEQSLSKNLLAHSPTLTRRQRGAPFAPAGLPADNRTVSSCASSASVAADAFCGHHGNRPLDSRL